MTTTPVYKASVTLSGLRGVAPKLRVEDAPEALRVGAEGPVSTPSLDAVLATYGYTRVGPWEARGPLSGTLVADVVKS